MGASNPVRLVVLPVELISKGSDIFRCSHLNGSLSALTCAGRQQAARYRPLTNPGCKACLRGEVVAKNAGLDPNARTLIPENVKAQERRLRAGKHAHTTGQSFQRPADDEEAA